LKETDIVTHDYGPKLKRLNLGFNRNYMGSLILRPFFLVLLSYELHLHFKRKRLNYTSLMPRHNYLVVEIPFQKFCYGNSFSKVLFGKFEKLVLK